MTKPKPEREWERGSRDSKTLTPERRRGERERGSDKKRKRDGGRGRRSRAERRAREERTASDAARRASLSAKTTAEDDTGEGLLQNCSCRSTRVSSSPPTLASRLSSELASRLSSEKPIDSVLMMMMMMYCRSFCFVLPLTFADGPKV